MPVHWGKRRNIDHVDILGDTCRIFTEFLGFVFYFLLLLMLNVNLQTRIFLRDFYFESAYDECITYLSNVIIQHFMAMISLCKSCNSKN